MARRRTTHIARQRRGALALLLSVVGVLALTGGAITGLGVANATPDAAQPSASSTPETPLTPPPLSDAQKLLVAGHDPNACAVSFAGDGIALPPELETAGQRYLHLPIPSADGRVFAGWYADEASAAARDVTKRINGAHLVQCDPSRVQTLHASWMTPAELAADQAQVPILMYHQFTDKPNGEDNWLKLNYYGIEDWKADLAYIHSGGFYLPTWDELSAFIDGRLWIPKRSVIITDDDADATWLDMAVPVVTADQVLTTSFVITSARQAGTPSIWVQQRSHTNDMHTAGDDGKGRMVNWTVDQIKNDLETSATILGAKEVIAYPFGHYNDTAKAGVAAAGFEMAVTIEHGYVTVGSDKLALPRVRMNFGMTVDDLKDLIG